MKKTIRLSALLLICVMILSSCYINLGGIKDAVTGTDYKELTNDIFTKYIEMNVSIMTNHKNVTETYDSQGSGVIFKEDRFYYYCLTNAHVVETNPSHPITTYTVIDCYGTEHIGAVIHSDSSYDLAVVKFHKGKEPLYVAEFSSADPLIGEDVIILGTPNGLINSVTYGDVVEYDTVEMSEGEDNIAFPVIWHDAPMWEGASGSVLLNTEMNIVGINFAVSTDDSDRFILGYAISVTKVMEYLNKNGLR
jgi:S1-C subfamily serine protease